MCYLRICINLPILSHLYYVVGDQLEWIQQCLAHGLYLVLGMIATSFIQAPPAVRCALILIVPLNLALTSYEGAKGALDFPGITLLLIVFTGGKECFFHKVTLFHFHAKT